VAVARDRCLYCGEALPSRLVPGQPPPGPSGSGEPEAQARTLIILALDTAEPARLVRALGLAPYEAGLLARRGGFHLHRVLAPPLAEAEAQRLHAEGLKVETVTEAETRPPPLRALGGERGHRTLTLRTEEGPVTLRRGDLLMVVRGPIARQYQPVYRRRRVDTSSLGEGYRVHLHRHADRRPVEIDAANFEFGFAVTGSTRLALEAWLEEIAAGVAEDDAFRRLPPAFGVAEPEPRGPLAAARALGRGGRGEGSGAEGESVVLDNLGQFRFYSAWRAALERRRAG
jgi:hypothetical protein